MFAQTYLFVHGFKQYLSNKNLIVFFFCFAVLFGPAVSILFGGDLSQFSDTRTYLGLFNLDFEQSPVRRYRVITPFLAKLLHIPFGGIFGKLAPKYYSGDFSAAFSFFLVNMTVTCFTGVMIYRYCRAYAVSTLAAVVGLLFFLSNRYSIYFAAVPLVDALYFMTLAMTVLGVKTKNDALLIAAIFIGPFAKEAFLFVAPVIFFFGHIPKSRQVLLFALSGIIVFSFRYIYDKAFGYAATSGVEAGLAHVWAFLYPLRMIFSGYGLYKMFMNVGVWLLLPIAAAFVQRSFFKNFGRGLERYVWAYLVSVLIQMVINLSTERMFYLAMPVLCLLMAFATDAVLKHLRESGIYKSTSG